MHFFNDRQTDTTNIQTDLSKEKETYKQTRVVTLLHIHAAFLQPVICILDNLNMAENMYFFNEIS